MIAVTKNLLVIGSKHGGLGDHLFLSPIPRIAKENIPGIKVFLSKQSVFRSNQVFDLIWKSNPFLDGSIDLPIDTRLEKSSADLSSSFVMNRMLESLNLPLDPFIKPELYCRPQIQSSGCQRACGRTLIDLNYVSYVGALTFNDKAHIVSKYIHKSPVLVNPSNSLKRKFPGLENISVANIFEYASMIELAAKFVCLPSGGATLAAALTSQADVFYGCGFQGIFRHPNHNNIMIGGSSHWRQSLGFALKLKNSIRTRIS